MSATVVSHRATTSSRRPGHVYTGVIYSALIPLRRCEDCGAVTSEAVFPGQHAPHWRGGVLVNCVGAVLAQNP